MARTGYERAILATAYAALRNQQHYQDPGIDYEEFHEERNAPRWLAQMRKFGCVCRSAVSARSV